MTKLEELEDNKVVDISLENGNTSLSICEACDFYFNVDYNKQQFGELIEELNLLYGKMRDADE